MDNKLTVATNNSVQYQQNPVMNVTFENRLDIIEECIRKSYLSRLTELQIVPFTEALPLEKDIIDNIRLYHITEMVYQKGESASEKFTTVFNTLSTYNASVFIIIDSDGIRTDYYLGVRNNELDDTKKRSTVTLGDTLKHTLIGHFPGIKINNEDRKRIAEISKKVEELNNIASVSVVGNNKQQGQTTNEQFVQGLEKLALSMYGRRYTGIVIAESQPSQAVDILRNMYQNLYTSLSPYQKIQNTTSETKSASHSQSFAEMNGRQKAAIIGGAASSLVGVAAGAIIGGAVGSTTGASLGLMLGGQAAGQLSGFIHSLAPTEQVTNSTSTSSSSTTENKSVTDLLSEIDESLKRVREFDNYGMWNVSGYFLSDDMSASEIAASNYRSLMNGDSSGREVSAINSCRSNDTNINGDFRSLTKHLSRFVHPRFYYGVAGSGITVDASTAISGKELGLHIGLPRATVPGLPVIEHAEFGKEVFTYRLIHKDEISNPKDRMTLGKVFDLGQITSKVVELDNRSLNMHTFITGSTGSGKSNTVYQMLTELHQDGVPFLVIEPAKGEYKDVFGNWSDVNVYSTNPNIAEMIHINPFRFPSSIHVLEHIDGLVEIFSVCWPMYDAMPAFFKDAILKSYEEVGWDLGSSTYDGDEVEYPDFEVLTEQLDKLIEASDYASDIKSNYRGALITRVKSLTVGLNRYLFTHEVTPYSKLFDENCILDISRIKSSETKALIMGLVVYILNEYRVDKKDGNNKGLEHVTVLEEAHNLLKNTAGNNSSELTGKSVEMLTQTIAEIRTYGEGFIIVDQSPSSVDIAAIKNTNTKIVLRTPEANDREAVGRSIGLTETQVNEIAKLPSGVAVVYQNDWVSPVLTMVDKANVQESPYRYENKATIRPLREARTAIICMLMQPWIPRERMRGKELKDCLKSLELTRHNRGQISDYIDDYVFGSGKLIWLENEIPTLQTLVKAVLNLSENEFNNILLSQNPNLLRAAVRDKTKFLSNSEIDEICNVLTKVGETT